MAVPITELLLVAGALLPEYRDPAPGRPDLPGVALSLAVLLPPVYALKQIAKDGPRPGALAVLAVLAGGVYAVEQLRPVFSEVHAVSIRNTLSFANFWELFDEDRTLKDPAALEGPASSFLDQLAWWGRALKEARVARPYRP